MSDARFNSSGRDVNARSLLFLGDYGVWGEALYGSQLRSERLAAGLAASYDVTYACMGEPPRAKESQAWMHRRGISALIVGNPFDYAKSSRWGGAVDVVRSLMQRTVPLEIQERATSDFVHRIAGCVGSCDPVWAHRSWMAEAALRAGYQSIVCDIDDFEGELAKQARANRRSKRDLFFRVLDKQLSRYESSMHRRFARVVVTKTEDLSLVDSGNAHNCHVVPNGFDLPAPIPYASQNRRELLFVGTLDYGPNVDAILWFYREIFPAIRNRFSDTMFRVVGRGPCPDVIQNLQIDKSVVIEVSPATLGQAYASASVVVTPIRLGHGTRIKAMEAIAYCRPLVSTSECLRGHPIIADEHALVADTAADFSSACIRILSDQQLAARLTTNGRKLAEATRGWDRSVSLACKVLELL